MKKKLIAQSFGARMKNRPNLSRLLDPPGTKGGPQVHFRSGPPKHPLVLGGATTRDQRVFGPGSWLHPGPKGVLAGRGENAPAAHLLSRVDLITGTNEARFSFWRQNFGLSAFFCFFYLFF